MSCFGAGLQADNTTNSEQFRWSKIWFPVVSFKVFRFTSEICAYYKWTSFRITYVLLCPICTFTQRILAVLVTVSNH